MILESLGLSYKLSVSGHFLCATTPKGVGLLGETFKKNIPKMGMSVSSLPTPLYLLCGEG